MTLTLIGGWGNYDHREISFFNQVNTGTLGGKGGPFDQVAYKQKLSQVSRLIFLSLYHLQVFFYRIKRISHWFKASQLWVQPIEGGLRLCRPIEGGPADDVWRLDPGAGFPARLPTGVQSTFCAKPNRRHWPPGLVGLSVT